MKVLILPGLDGMGALHEPFIDALGMESETVSYPHSFHSYDQIFDWVQDLLPNAPFIVVAESFSGPIAVRLAHAGNPNLRGVVLVATFARKPRYIPGFVLGLLSVLPINTKLLGFLSQPMAMGRWATRRFRKVFGDLLAPVPRRTLISRLRQVMLVDVAELAQGIPVPAIYLKAGSDRLVPARAARDFQQIQTIKGPHFLLQANPVDAAKAVADFITKYDLTQSR
jgi:pimeloyl-ACP methyl ester carboxylesterase